MPVILGSMLITLLNAIVYTPINQGVWGGRAYIAILIISFVVGVVALSLVAVNKEEDHPESSPALK
jgi:hypothetical protein